MRWLAALLIAGFLFSSSVYAGGIDGHALTVTIDGEHRGTATHIGGNQILTAAHLFGKDKDPSQSVVTVRVPGGIWHKATVIWVNKKLDVALLSVEGDVGDLPAVSLSCGALPSVGEHITISGFPVVGLVRVPITVGGVIASGKVKVTGWPEAILTDARVFPGHSGAGVLDSEGRDVGVAVGGLGNWASDNDGDPVFVGDIQVIVPAVTVCRLLKKAV